MKTIKQSGIGSLFVSKCLKEERARTSLDYDIDDFQGFIRKKLKSIFSLKQLELIGCAFEIDYAYNDNNSGDEVKRAIEFGGKFNDDKIRLI
mgnify:FL=1